MCGRSGARRASWSASCVMVVLILSGAVSPVGWGEVGPVGQYPTRSATRLSDQTMDADSGSRTAKDVGAASTWQDLIEKGICHTCRRYRRGQPLRAPHIAGRYSLKAL